MWTILLTFVFSQSSNTITIGSYNSLATCKVIAEQIATPTSAYAIKTAQCVQVKDK